MFNSYLKDFLAGKGVSTITALAMVFSLASVSMVSAAIVYGSVSSDANSSEPSESSSITISKPASTVSGNFLIAGIAYNGGTDTTITAPSGWTLIERTDGTGSTDDELGMATYRKFAGSSEPSSYTWTVVNTEGASDDEETEPRAAGGIIRYTGVHATSPIDVKAESEGSDDVFIAPSVTTNFANDLVVVFFAQDDEDSSHPTPSGTSERYDVENLDGNGPHTSAADFTQVSAGSTGTKSFDSGSDQEDWVTQTIALRMAEADTDGDGIVDTSDNCPSNANANQANNDADSQGDLCDTDDDNDTVSDTSDNCPINANANQLDSDDDGLGDVCDETPLPDACPNVTGNQQSGPCLDAACVSPFIWNTEGQTCDAPPCPEGQIGSYPNCETPEPEVCPEGTEGVYPECVELTCAEGEIGIYPICIAAPTDACPSDIGFQLTGPCNSDDVCPNDEGIQTNSEDCTQDENEEDVDVCLNIEGAQTSVPDGMSVFEGECVTSGDGGGNGGTGSGGGTDPVDMCANIEGAQEIVPEGHLYSQGNCIAPSNAGSTDPVPAAPTATESPAVETPAGEVLGESCEPIISSFMGERRKNDPEEVKKLQSFLNTDLGSTLDIDGVFGPSTTSAVKEFQIKYSSEILAPWLPFGLKNDKAATGYVYKTTLRWINKLSCESLEIPMPQLP